MRELPMEKVVRLPFRVSDLKQWVYCPRILYYHHCLPRVRPTTYKMEEGTRAGHAEETREERRSLRAYGLLCGDRQFHVSLASERLGLRGEVDLVIDTHESGTRELIPVDYKDSTKVGAHFKLQLAAYALLLEETRGIPVRRGFLYFIPIRRAQEVLIDKGLRKQLADALEAMRAMLNREQMPPPAASVRKCLPCEFRRFCNDVL